MTRRRRWLLVLAVLLALGVAGSLLLRHLTRPELLARLLVEQVEQRTGLILNFGAEPDIGLFPRLSLELDEISLALPGGEVLLAAETLQLALPWRALREPVVSLDSLSVHGASIDLDVLWQLGQREEQAGPPPPLRLPPIATQLQLTDSRIVSTERGFSLEGLRIDSAPLLEGVLWRFNARGSLHSDAGESPRTFVFDLAAVPRHSNGGLRLSDFSMSLEYGAAPPLLAQLSGVIDLAPPQTSGEVVLKLSHWPRAIPDFVGEGDPIAPVELALRWSALGGGNGNAVFRLSRDDLSLEGEAEFGDVLGWLTAGDIAVGPGAASGLPPSPPVRGAVRIPRLALDDMKLEGIEITLRDKEADSQE